MVSIARLHYSLPTDPTVKWLATQERNLNRDLEYPDEAAEAPEDYVSRTYLQFLWLPQSIMPLQFLIPALLRVTSSSDPAVAASQQAADHPLHALLKPILLTSRAVSQKYHTRIPDIIAEENEPADPEEDYVWYAYQKDKVGEEERQEGQDEDEAQENLKKAWLEKYERREVQVQMLLYFLLISLPGHRPGLSAEGAQSAIADPLPLPPSLSPSKSKKRKHEDRGRGRAQNPPPLPPLEERLESFMDKLAMWQLMHSVDTSLGRGVSSKSAADKGKARQKDDRDWMQAFCEDVAEPLFKAKLPELCALFRSKLFPETARSDTDSLGLSPPGSPKPAAKRVKSSATSAASSKSTSKSTAKGKDKDASRSRSNSNSLSLSLEQERRERSRSLSMGPKRPPVYEVTMTTKFGKARAKQKAELERAASVPGPSLSRTQSQPSVAAGASTQDAKRVSKMGSVLVAATPSKPRDGMSRSQSQRTQSQSQPQARLSALLAQPPTSTRITSLLSSRPTLTRMDSFKIDSDDDDDDDADVVATPTKARRQPSTRAASGSKNGEEEDKWNLRSSPAALLLSTSNSRGPPKSEDDEPPESSSPGDLGGFGDARTPPRVGSSRGRIMAEDTPTKF